MATCDTTKYVGRSVPLQYQIGCADVLPDENGWLTFGSMTTKKFDLKWDNTDVTGDDSVGALRENLATFLSAEVSGDGFCPTRTASHYQNFKDLNKHFLNPVATGGQPVLWLRLTYPDLTFTVFALLTELSRDTPSDDGVKFTLTASATASEFGLIVDDTPDPDAPEVTGVTVVPATLTLGVGDTYDIQVVVLPTNADQRVTWDSDQPAEVSVNPVTGVVKALTTTATTATITATSTADDQKTGTCVVTVA